MKPEGLFLWYKQPAINHYPEAVESSLLSHILTFYLISNKWLPGFLIKILHVSPNVCYISSQFNIPRFDHF
jgi:hypothetical protein